MGVIKKKIIFLLGYSNVGKDTFCDIFNDKQPCERISGGDLVKQIATDKYNWNGKKNKSGRTLLNMVTKKYVTNLNLAFDDGIITKTQVKKYNDTYSIWSNLLINKIKKSKNDVFIMTDLRFIPEYLEFCRYEDIYDMYFIHIISKDSIPTSSCEQLGEIIDIITSSSIINYFVVYNNKNYEFKNIVYTCLKIINLSYVFDINNLFLNFQNIYKVTNYSDLISYKTITDIKSYENKIYNRIYKKFTELKREIPDSNLMTEQDDDHVVLKFHLEEFLEELTNIY